MNSSVPVTQIHGNHKEVAIVSSVHSSTQGLVHCEQKKNLKKLRKIDFKFLPTAIMTIKTRDERLANLKEREEAKQAKVSAQVEAAQAKIKLE